MPNKNTPKKNSKETKPEIKAVKKGKTENPTRVPVKFQHKIALKELAVNGGSLKKALKKAGFSKSVQETPAKVTKTKSWKALLDEFLPESKLLEVHDKQLQSYKLQSMIFQKQIDDEIIYELIESVHAIVKRIVEIPTGKVVFFITADNQSRNKALEMGLKLHKKLTDKVEVKDTTPFTQLSDEELRDRIKKGKNFFLKK